MSIALRIGALVTIATLALTPARAYAQAAPSDGPPVDLRMRYDTFFRGVPRYVLSAQDGAASSDDRYWRAITLAPLQERATLDATQLLAGHLEVHLAVWGAIDLAAPTTDGRIAGDFAVAWMKYRRGPFGVWGGRKFISWGAPGGVHLDGVGGEILLGAGFSAEAIAGRPVTPVYGSLLGAHPGFDDTTFAGGARVGWAHPGLIATSASVLEHWAHGIPARRVVEMSFVFNPLHWINAHGSISWDLLGMGVMQANIDAAAWIGRALTLEAGAGHENPALLIPRWSILSVFVTRTFDEARARVTWRIVPAIQIGLEGALQHYNVDGVDVSQWGPAWGSRVEAFVRVTAIDRRIQFVADASHRDEGVRKMTLVRVAGSFPVAIGILGAIEGAVALDNDDFNSYRTSWYARLSGDGPIVPGWRIGASVEIARTPIVESELRGMVHLTTHFDLHLGGRR